jgi:hypothetical protein
MHFCEAVEVYELIFYDLGGLRSSQNENLTVESSLRSVDTSCITCRIVQLAVLPTAISFIKYSSKLAILATI